MSRRFDDGKRVEVSLGETKEIHSLSREEGVIFIDIARVSNTGSEGVKGVSRADGSLDDRVGNKHDINKIKDSGCRSTVVGLDVYGYWLNSTNEYDQDVFLASFSSRNNVIMH